MTAAEQAYRVAARAGALLVVFLVGSWGWTWVAWLFAVVLIATTVYAEIHRPTPDARFAANHPAGKGRD